jgi:peptidoglycan/LPS O-acetylase OafA/YrhL
LLPLTGVRFFLAFWVVMYHQPFFPDAQWLARFPVPVPVLIRTGFLAVGVFFVLSGFVLSYNYPLGRDWSWKNVAKFGMARFSRIYPAYCVGLLLCVPFVVHPLLKKFSLAELRSFLTVASLNWTLMQAWLPKTAQSWNGPGWSLSVEAFFYCCFPLVGVALWKLSRPSSILVASLLLWAASLIVPLLAGAAPLTDQFWFGLIAYNPLLHLPQFCIGILIGRMYDLLHIKNSMLLGRGYYLYLPGLLLEVIVISLYMSLGGNLLVLHNGLLLPLHSLIILGLSLGGGTLARLLSIRPLVFLGNASYALYIFHMPVANWMKYISQQVFSTKLEGFGATALYIVIVVGLSSIVFKTIEEPANHILKKLSARGAEQSGQRLGSLFGPDTTNLAANSAVTSARGNLRH